MVDLHSHVLYGVDDGAKDEEMAINMLKIAQENGTKKLICTPHYFRGRYIKPFDEIKDEVSKLRDIAKKNNIEVELYYGQEVYLTEHLLDDLDKERIGTMNDSKYILVEMNMNEIPSSALDIIYELKLRGLVVILAHPERYVPFIEDPTLINDFIEEGCLFQLNAGSIKGNFGKLVKKTAEKFLDYDIYSFIGSDGHYDHKRSTSMKEAMEYLNTYNKNLVSMFKNNGENVILNEDVYFEGSLIEKKAFSFLGFFRKNAK